MKVNIHNIGGLRRLHTWEIADIAILVFVQIGNRIIAQKIGLLQSKRLYPANNEVDEEDEVGFLYGLNAYFDPQPRAIGAMNRQYDFNTLCIYGALKSGSKQRIEIDRFNKKFGVSVFYLFYNPDFIPSSINYPLVERKIVYDLSLGCRVSRANSIHKLLDTLSKGKSPTLNQVSNASTPTGGWPLEEWTADLLLTCKAGQSIEANRDELVERLIMRRSGPIGAAIALNIILPERS